MPINQLEQLYQNVHRLAGNIFAIVDGEAYNHADFPELVASGIVPDCPPEITPAMGIRGTGLIQLPGNSAHHLVVTLSASACPNVWDYLFFLRSGQVSHRLPQKMDYSRLSSKSRLLIVHPRARILDTQPYLIGTNSPFRGGWRCPLGQCSHQPRVLRTLESNAPSCCGLWVADIEGGAPYALRDEGGHYLVLPDGSQVWSGGLACERIVERHFRGYEYYGLSRPTGYTGHAPGIIASLPLLGLGVCGGIGFDEAWYNATKAGLKVQEIPTDTFASFSERAF